MLKVTVKKNEVVDERWEPGMIRMSENGKVVILVSCDIKFDANRAIVLVDESEKHKPYISICSRSTWVKACPVVVENAELIIGGGNND